jgi:PadR family transcriptional regulator PadR
MNYNADQITAGRMTRSSDKVFLGEFEQVVLLAVLHLGERAYGVPIRQEIARRARRRVSRGALYTALDRLEDKKCLTSRMSDPLPERGGRSRRYYSVTPLGLSALQSARQTLLRLWQGLESTLEAS